MPSYNNTKIKGGREKQTVKSDSKQEKNKLRFQAEKETLEKVCTHGTNVYMSQQTHTHWLLQACTPNAEIYLTAELQ